MQDQPSPETIKKVIQAANAVAWKRPDLDVLRPELAGDYSPLAECLQREIRRADDRKKLVLPNLAAFENKTVAIFSDYGGESNGACYYTYTTLVSGWDLTGHFLEAMRLIRQQHGLGEKEIAFKDFRMGQLRRALPAYLAALDTVPGLLFTLAVDKKLASVFGPAGRETKDFLRRALKEAGASERKSAVTEKLLRVIHLAAFLTGLLARDGQKIFWMTDHDAIAPTREVHQETLALFQRVLGLYARKGFMFPLIGGAVPFEERSIQMLDLLSSTDVVAGSLDQYLTQRDSVPPEDIKVKQGCDLVLKWLAHDGIGLKKMNVIMKSDGAGNILTSALEIGLKEEPPNVTKIPIVV